MDTEDVKIAVSYWPEKGNEVKHYAREKMEDSSFLEIEWLDPEIVHEELHQDGVDFYHMGKQRKGSDKDLRGFQQNGVAVLNSREAVELANDRVLSARTLDEYGVPVPEWGYGTQNEVEVETPAVAKDRYEFCSSGHGHELLEDKVSFDGEKLVQEFHDGDTFKGYRIPHEQDRPKVFAEYMDGNRKKGGEEVMPTSRMEKIIEEVHNAMGLELFEADMVLSDTDYLVVDVNPFVSLRGIEEGSRLYSDALYDAAYGMDSDRKFVENN